MMGRTMSGWDIGIGAILLFMGFLTFASLYPSAPILAFAHLAFLNLLGWGYTFGKWWP